MSYTASDPAEMRRRGEGMTDWEKVRARTDDEIEAQSPGYPQRKAS